MTKQLNAARVPFGTLSRQVHDARFSFLGGGLTSTTVIFDELFKPFARSAFLLTNKAALVNHAIKEDFMVHFYAFELFDGEFGLAFHDLPRCDLLMQLLLGHYVQFICVICHIPCQLLYRA